MTTITKIKEVATPAQLDSRDTYLAFIADWAATKNRTAIEHAAYIIGAGLLAKHQKDTGSILDELIDAFGPITNSIKLANGRKAFDTLDSILGSLMYRSSSNLDAELELRIKEEASELLTELRIQLRNGR